MRRAALFCLSVLILAGSAFASRKDEITLVLVPREDSVIRVGLDIFQRYPTLLVSYEVQPNGAVSFHGWTGKEWVNITPEAFQAGDFFRTGPDSALIVDEGSQLPAAYIPAESWCTSVYKITTTEVRPLLHLTGQFYDFKYKDWKWFSENYKMSMDAINPEGLNVAWYHKQLGDNLKKGPVAADDLQFWIAVRHPVPPLDEVVPVETNQVEMVEESSTNMQETVVSNPLTNSVPEAVVLGPDDAEEGLE